MLNSLVIIRRNSRRGVVALHLWSKILEKTFHRVHFQVGGRSPAYKVLKKGIFHS